MQELHVKSLLPVRLDKYLMEQFPALGLGRLNKALRENKIKLNGKKQPLATRVQNGDVIRVYLLDDQLGLTSQEGPEFLQARAPAEFIYENDDLIVANKPAGIPVDGDESDTLLDRVRRYVPKGHLFADEEDEEDEHTRMFDDEEEESDDDEEPRRGRYADDDEESEDDVMAERIIHWAPPITAVVCALIIAVSLIYHFVIA